MHACVTRFNLYCPLLILGDVHRSFVSSLVVKVLAVDTFSKAKYTYGAVLLDFTSVSTFLDVRKDLPLELMEAMSHQTLAPHVSVCVCVCVRACVRVCMRACVRACVCVDSKRKIASTVHINYILPGRRIVVQSNPSTLCREK